METTRTSQYKIGGSDALFVVPVFGSLRTQQEYLLRGTHEKLSLKNGESDALSLIVMVHMGLRQSTRYVESKRNSQ